MMFTRGSVGVTEGIVSVIFGYTWCVWATQ